METDKKFWRSNVKFVQASSLEELQGSVNNFCKDKFVVGIQYPDAWQSATNFVAVISYKVQESGD